MSVFRLNKAHIYVIHSFILLFSALTVQSVGPSFDCSKAVTGSIEEMICKDENLSTLDVKMSAVYKEAAAGAVKEHPPVLKTEQRGWIKGRDECWKSEDKKKCVVDSYKTRIAELQTRYRLVPSTGPVYYNCDNQAKEVVMTFFQTDPPTLIAEFGDSVSLMYLEPAGSGSKYEGQNESIWIKGNDATVGWGYEAPEMNCKVKP